MSLDEAKSEEYFNKKYEEFVQYRDLIFNPVYEFL